MTTIRQFVDLIENIVDDTYSNAILELYDDYDTLNDLLEDEELSDIIDELLEHGMKGEFKFLLDHLDIEYEKHNSKSDEEYLIILSNGMSIEMPIVTVHDEPDDVIYGWNDSDVLSFFGHVEHEWSNKFWNTIKSTTYVYHATIEEKWESIQHEGIEARNDTRGMTNRTTASAVFVTTDSDDLSYGSYGNVHIQIDLFKMKQDGFTPMISEEEPWIVDQYRSVLASMFDKEYSADGSDGISPTTLVIFDDIPRKYIERID